MIVEIICGCLATVSIIFAARCYWELRKWARQCQGARIAIAYKRKVQLQAPLVEWLMWCNQLDKDKDSHGRVVWRQGYASVAITKAVTPKRSSKKRQTATPSREGTWSAKDETVRT